MSLDSSDFSHIVDEQVREAWASLGLRPLDFRPALARYRAENGVIVSIGYVSEQGPPWRLHLSIGEERDGGVLAGHWSGLAELLNESGTILEQTFTDGASLRQAVSTMADPGTCDVLRRLIADPEAVWSFANEVMERAELHSREAEVRQWRARATTAWESGDREAAAVWLSRLADSRTAVEEARLRMARSSASPSQQ